MAELCEAQDGGLTAFGRRGDLRRSGRPPLLIAREGRPFKKQNRDL